jgi:hypothetical protein
LDTSSQPEECLWILVNDVFSWVTNKNVSDIRSFLRLVGYYQQVIEGFSTILIQ